MFHIVRQRHLNTSVFWLFIINVLFISGCKVTPTLSQQTHSNLNIVLSGTDKDTFKLVDSSGITVAKDSGADGVLQFSIPVSARRNQCFAVYDKNNEPISDTKYALTIFHQTRELERAAQVYHRQVSAAEQQQIQLDNALTNAFQRLENQAAFSPQDRACHQTKQRPLPREPYTKCRSRDECLEEGAAICFSRFIGAEGCSHAASKYNISGILASPSCAATAAKLAGQKYDMDDVFVDALHGLVDDIASAALKNGTASEQFWGGVLYFGNMLVKANSAVECTNQFVNVHYGPKIRWYNQVQQIRQEPAKNKQYCQNLIRDHNRIFEQNKQVKQSLPAKRSLLKDILIVKKSLESQTEDALICDKGRAPVNQQLMTYHRYTIGATVQTKTANTTKREEGALVTEIIAESPALRSGIKSQDVIVKVNEQAINNIEQLIHEVQKSGGKQIIVTLLRQNKPLVFNITPKGTPLKI